MGEGRLVEGEEAVDEAGVVLEVAVEVRRPVPPRPEQTAVRVQRFEHEGGVLLRGLAVAGLAEHHRRLGERPQREAVPRGQHLVVGGGRHAGRAFRQQAAAHRLQAFEERFAGHPEIAAGRLGTVGHVQYVVPLEVAGPAHAVEAVEDRGVGLAEQRLDLLGVPHVVLALHTLAVGVLGGEEAALGVAEVAEEVVERLTDDRLEPPLTGQLVPLEVGDGQLGVVVEHLLEVRHQPRLVGGVAREAAAEVVVHAAVGHRPQRVLDEVTRARLAGARVVTQQESKHHGLGELRCAAEPAVLLIERRRDAREGLGRDARAQGLVARDGLRGGQDG